MSWFKKTNNLFNNIISAKEAGMLTLGVELEPFRHIVEEIERYINVAAHSKEYKTEWSDKNEMPYEVYRFLVAKGYTIELKSTMNYYTYLIKWWI